MDEQFHSLLLTIQTLTHVQHNLSCVDDFGECPTRDESIKLAKILTELCELAATVAKDPFSRHGEN